MIGCRPIERLLERLGQRAVGGLVGSGRTGRRHRLRSQFPYDLLPAIGVRVNVGDVQGIDQQSCRLEALVVARHAVPLQDRLRSLGCLKRWRRHGLIG